MEYLVRLRFLCIWHDLIESLRSLICDIPTIPITSKLIDKINPNVDYSLIKR